METTFFFLINKNILQQIKISPRYYLSGEEKFLAENLESIYGGA